MREPGTVKTSMLYNKQPIRKCNTHVITYTKHGAIVFIKKYNNNNKYAHTRQECTVSVVTMLLGWMFEKMRLTSGKGKRFISSPKHPQQPIKPPI
jgi:hypothetical protein